MPPAIAGPSISNPNPMDRPNPLTKPHLIKQRRRGAASISRSSKPPVTGFNPFYMDSDSNSSGMFAGFAKSETSSDSNSNSGDTFVLGANVQSYKDSGPFVFGNSAQELPAKKSKNDGDEKENKPVFVFGSSENLNASSNLHEKVQTWHPFVFGEKPKENPSLINSENKTTSGKSNLSGNFIFGSSSYSPNEKDETVNIINLEKKLEKEVHIGSSSTSHEMDQNLNNNSSGTKSEKTTHQKEETLIFGVNIKKSTVSTLDEKMKKMDIGKDKKENPSFTNFSFNTLPDEIQKLHIGTEKMQNSSRARYQRYNTRDNKKGRYKPSKLRNPSGSHQIPVFVPDFTIPVPEHIPVFSMPVPEPIPVQELGPVPKPDSPGSYSPMDCSPYPYENENPNYNENNPNQNENPNENENQNPNQNDNPKIEEKEEKDTNEASGSFKGFESNASSNSINEDNKKEFIFSASSSVQDHVPVQGTYRRHFRRINRYYKGSTGTSTGTSSSFVQPGDFTTNQSAPPVRDAASSVSETRQADKGSEALETIEKWRNRGNQAYAKSKLAKAEEYYTRGISSIPLESSGRCNRALMLCYSNRAATRMALGRMSEALHDCVAATNWDPKFLKAQVRAGNCLLALGRFNEAGNYYNRCLYACNNGEDKIVSEASQGLGKAQKMIEYVNKANELLMKKTSSEVTRAMDLISDVLLIGTNSDNLIKMKAEALLLLRRYEEMIELCEQSLEMAQKNSNLEIDNPKIWRWCLVSRAYFYLGKLEESLELIKKYNQVQPLSAKCGEYLPSAAIIGELLRLKAIGNEAYQGGRYSEAIESYNAAIAYNGESCVFSAICFGNRAAAYQALGQVVNAIFDCSLAIALHPNYAKAISRRATLYEMIRDYGQAANDLRRLISLLNNNNNDEINRAQMRLSKMEEESRKRTPLNMFLILGIERSSPGADVKKAYRKAALRHHPDKAGQFLVRSETLDDSVWSEITNEVHRDADHLFKIIGEAYNILSDPTKRLDYETEEDMKNVKKSYYNGRSKSPEEQYRSWRPYRNCSSRHHWSESYDPYW